MRMLYFNRPLFYCREQNTTCSRYASEPSNYDPSLATTDERILLSMADTSLSTLAEQIGQLHAQTQRAAAQQINSWLTVRNWLIGYYIAEYEQHGSDRATYGEQLLSQLPTNCAA